MNLFTLLGKRKSDGFSGTFRGSTEYKILRLLGEGGMGAVYKSKMLGVNGFEKTVAIKTLLDRYTNDPTFVNRFIEEAKLVANLIHENIVQIYQLDKCRAGYYFVLEFVDGVSLHELMEFHKLAKLVMPVNLAVFIAARIARGLAYAHSRTDAEGKSLNIVHCDVCNHNIMINTEGVPKIMDFGIARAVTREAVHGISGKLGFMAPEQAVKGADIACTADIYSLGVVLFYLLSGGQLTRKLDGDMSNMLMEIRSNYIAWELLPPDIDDDLMAILKKMLGKNPAERYADTNQLARDLEYYIYKDGYGPTIVTLAAYIREVMPGIFGPAITGNAPGAVISDDGKTMMLGSNMPDNTTIVEK